MKEADQRKTAPPPSTGSKSAMPVISSVESLASTGRGRGRPPKSAESGSTTSSSINLSQLPELRVNLEPLPTMPTKRGRVSNRMNMPGAYALMDSGYDPSPPPTPPPAVQRTEVHTHLITVAAIKPNRVNAGTICQPYVESKALGCKPHMESMSCQTDASLQRRIVVPIPIPVYVPTPMKMYMEPFPLPVPFALPIPIPIFVPTSRNSANGIVKEIKKIQEKMPSDPFEAELLMMAEMVAGDGKKDDSDSSDEDEGIQDTNQYTDNITSNNSFNEDLVQMALKMASNDYEEPAVDLESAMQASTINQSQMMDASMDPHSLQHHHMLMMEQQRQMQQQQQHMPAQRGRKRQNAPRGGGANRNNVSANKRIKHDESVYEPPQPEPTREPLEKPDANMCLKYTFGVNAWKQWVMTKNAEIEKSSTPRKKLFKSEILQLTADELNFSLCLFVKEVRKPNGSEYAPDTIYYLVLGIQQYLFENGRIDNIFTDPYYERFTDCLDEVAKKFSVLYNDSQYIVTRVEEEHLWECKQLGAHSPHVLLSTLMFFNTKHFNLVTVEEHMELSFSHIMKHWKRNPNSSGATQKTPGSRNVLLRFYPPQASLVGNSRKKKVYEQQENEENPLRCPVKLYEFYLSKCPESVKTRNDVFYLQPERSCVPDSPVWYSTQALNREGLSKMLHRVKMVKEINIALLTS